MITIIKFDTSSYWHVHYQHDGTCDQFKAIDRRQALSLASEKSGLAEIEYTEKKYQSALVLESTI